MTKFSPGPVVRFERYPYQPPRDRIHWRYPNLTFMRTMISVPPSKFKARGGGGLLRALHFDRFSHLCRRTIKRTRARTADGELSPHPSGKGLLAIRNQIGDTRRRPLPPLVDPVRILLMPGESQDSARTRQERTMQPLLVHSIQASLAAIQILLHIHPRHQ